jgi:hypothetical protein
MFVGAHLVAMASIVVMVILVLIIGLGASGAGGDHGKGERAGKNDFQDISPRVTRICAVRP